MKAYFYSLALLIGFGACQKNESVDDFTGKQITYALQQASDYPISGSVIIKERKDQSVSILVELTGTDGNSKYPVHLHLGDLSTPDAPVAASLEPLKAKTGRSETILFQLADESSICYSDLVKLKASIKIHLAESGAQKDIILAAGNIGESVSSPVGSEISQCKNN